MKNEKKSSFSSSIGFVLAAAGSAVGVGNIWRFPYLAAKDGGGLFILVYIILAVTFGFTLLTTDVAVGRKTCLHAVHAYQSMHPKWGFLGKITFLVPAIIMTYYAVIGGWVMKYFVTYVTFSGEEAATAGYFSEFTKSHISPIVYMLIFLVITAVVVYNGVEKGIEKFSRVIMPGLLVLIVAIVVFSLTLSYTDANGVTRTGMQGLAVYLIPNLEGITIGRFLQIMLDAMSQIFFSLSVSMGIMITYGVYVPKEADLSKSVEQIEVFDLAVALLAGMMVIPAVYVFAGMEGMTQGPGLMFVSLPKVFAAMGSAGNIIGCVFFIMVAFAALTSSVSILETLVASCMEMFDMTRKKACLILTALSALASVIICLGYNVLYFEITLPNGSANQQLLDVMDYISNSFLMPAISFLSCIFIGWIMKPDWIADEMEQNGHKFRRRNLYNFMIRYMAPISMGVLFLQSAGVLNWI